MTRITKLLSLFTLLVLITTSCEHKELCFHHYASLRITFDWVNAPGANPETMRVYLYPIGNETNYTVVDLPREGGYIKDVAPGEYRILCFNNTETSYERSVGSFVSQSLTTSLTSFLDPLSISTYSSVPVAAGTEDEEPHFEPETIWGCTEVNATVSENGVTYHFVADPDSYGNPLSNTDCEIVLYPEQLTCTYTVEIRNVKNLEGVNLMSATLSGLASELNLASGAPSGDGVIVPFAVRADGDSTIIGSFSNFGAFDNVQNRLMLYVLLSDNKLYAFGVENWARFNVTEQVRNAKDPRNVHIIIDGLDLPAGIGSGFAAEIDDWGEELNQEVVI